MISTTVPSAVSLKFVQNNRDKTIERLESYFRGKKFTYSDASIQKSRQQNTPEKDLKTVNGWLLNGKLSEDQKQRVFDIFSHYPSAVKLAKAVLGKDLIAIKVENQLFQGIKILLAAQSLYLSNKIIHKKEVFIELQGDKTVAKLIFDYLEGSQHFESLLNEHLKKDPQFIVKALKQADKWKIKVLVEKLSVHAAVDNKNTLEMYSLALNNSLPELQSKARLYLMKYLKENHTVETLAHVAHLIAEHDQYDDKQLTEWVIYFLISEIVKNYPLSIKNDPKAKAEANEQASKIVSLASNALQKISQALSAKDYLSPIYYPSLVSSFHGPTTWNTCLEYLAGYFPNNNKFKLDLSYKWNLFFKETNKCYLFAPTLSLELISSLPPYLRELNLEGGILSNEMLETLFHRCPHLEKLSLARTKSVDGKPWEFKLSHNLDQMTCLDLENCLYIHKMLIPLIQNCPHITQLNLRGILTEEPSKTMSALRDSCPQLKILCPPKNIMYEDLMTLVEKDHKLNLKALDLAECNYVDFFPNELTLSPRSTVFHNRFERLEFLRLPNFLSDFQKHCILMYMFYIENYEDNDFFKDPTSRIQKEISEEQKEAVRFYTLGVEVGDRLAMTALGFCYENGIGISQDVNKAFELYTESRKNGCLAGWEAEGYYWIEGKGGVIDEVKGREYLYTVWGYYSPRDESDSVTAAYLLGEHYGKKECDKESLESAVECFTFAAKHKHANALNRLGQCYLEGLGVIKDERKGEELLTEAAANGSTAAKLILLSRAKQK